MGSVTVHEAIGGQEDSELGNHRTVWLLSTFICGCIHNTKWLLQKAACLQRSPLAAETPV